MIPEARWPLLWLRKIQQKIHKFETWQGFQAGGDVRGKTTEHIGKSDPKTATRFGGYGISQTASLRWVQGASFFEICFAGETGNEVRKSTGRLSPTKVTLAKPPLAVLTLKFAPRTHAPTGVRFQISIGGSIAWQQVAFTYRLVP